MSITYEWELRDASDDSVVASGVGLPPTSDTPGSALAEGSYYLWVQATDEGGATTAVSSIVEVDDGYPDPSDVLAGVVYGPNGEYTGTATGGGGDAGLVDGNLLLVADDTYDGIGNPKVSWATDADYTNGWTATLTIRDEDDLLVVTVAGAIESDSLVSFGLTGPTGLAYKGCPGVWQGKYDVQLSKGDSRKTIAVGACYVTEDQTR